jgi:hypothetical protein
LALKIQDQSLSMRSTVPKYQRILLEKISLKGLQLSITWRSS